MKAPMLLFWMFAVPAHTAVLHPNLNVSILQSTVQSKNHNIMEKEKTGSDVKQRQNLIEKDKKPTGPVVSPLNLTYTQTLEFEEHLVPFAQNVSHHTTPSSKTSASPSSLTESVQAIPQPSFISISPIITNAEYISKPSSASPKHHFSSSVNATGPTKPKNISSTSDDVIMEQHAMNNLKLNRLAVSVNTTAMVAKAGPTANTLPRILKGKPKNKTTGTKPKGNITVKIKPKKLPKRNRAKEKKKALRKVPKEKKQKPTSAPHFPYFEDHYCPPECSCYGRVVQCSDKNLDKVPYGIPYNTRYVLLMNNRIDIIQSNLLSLYESMEFLVLRNNHLTNAAIEGAFRGIRSLKRLYLERNRLNSVPTDLPASLEELRLDGNQVSGMSGAALSHCPNLLILSLSNNSLGNSSVVPPGVFLPLGNLRTLTLSNNRLTSAPLQLPLGLRELYLRGNLIQHLQADMFWGEAELQVLDLSANRLTNKGLGKPSLLNASRLESLNLEGNLLKQVPRHLPRTIKTLNLEGNIISSIGRDAFISMPHLEHLGLAWNKISKVAVGAFRVLPLLHQLDVSHNGLRKVPRQLPLWLHSATFAHNKIQTVPRDAFCWGEGHRSSLSRLVRVQLEHNMIDLGSLDTQAFQCLRGFQVVQFY